MGATNDHIGDYIQCFTALDWACWSGKSNVVQEILKAFPAELKRKRKPTERVKTILELAMWRDEIDIAHWLINFNVSYVFIYINCRKYPTRIKTK